MWKLTKTEAESFKQDFLFLNQKSGKIDENTFRSHYRRFGLPQSEMTKIWNLSDLDQDSYLNLQEYILSRILLRFADFGGTVPDKIPQDVIKEYSPKSQLKSPDFLMSRLKSESDTTSVKILSCNIDASQSVHVRKTDTNLSARLSPNIAMESRSARNLSESGGISMSKILYKRPASVFSNMDVNLEEHGITEVTNNNDQISTLRKTATLSYNENSQESILKKDPVINNNEYRNINIVKKTCGNVFDRIPIEDKTEYIRIYSSKSENKSSDCFLSNLILKELLLSTHVPGPILKKIWDLSDYDKDGTLACNEFCVAMHLCKKYSELNQLPDVISDNLKQSAFVNATSGTDRPQKLTVHEEESSVFFRINEPLSDSKISSVSYLNTSNVDQRITCSSNRDYRSIDENQTNNGQSMQDLKSFFAKKVRVVQSSDQRTTPTPSVTSVNYMEMTEELNEVKRLLDEYKQKLFAADATSISEETKNSFNGIPEQVMCLTPENFDRIEVATKFMKLCNSAIAKIKDEKSSLEAVEKELTSYHIKLNSLLMNQKQAVVTKALEKNNSRRNTSGDPRSAYRNKTASSVNEINKRYDANKSQSSSNLDISSKEDCQNLLTSRQKQTSRVKTVSDFEKPKVNRIQGALRKKKDGGEVVETAVISQNLSKISSNTKNVDATVVDYKIPVKTVCVALVAHKAISKGELTINVGDLLTVHLTKPLEQESHVLLAIKENGEKGFVPAKYIDYYNPDNAPVKEEKPEQGIKLQLSSDWETAPLTASVLEPPIKCIIKGQYYGVNGHIFKIGDEYVVLKKTKTNHLIYSDKLLPRSQAEWVPTIFLALPYLDNLKDEFVNITRTYFKNCHFSLCIQEVEATTDGSVIVRGDVGFVFEDGRTKEMYFNGSKRFLDPKIVKKITIGDYPVKEYVAFAVKSQYAKNLYELSFNRGQKINLFILNAGGWSFGCLEDTKEWGWLDSSCAPICSRPQSSNTRQEHKLTSSSKPADLNFYGICIDNYTPQSNKDIPCKMWDVVRVLEIPSVWWRVSINGKEGVLPYHFIDISMEIGDVNTQEEPISINVSDDSEITSKERKRICTISELINTERIFLKDLFYVYDIFYCQFISEQVISKYEADSIFLNWRSLIACSAKILDELKKRARESNFKFKFIGDLLMEKFSTFQPYILYFEKHGDAIKKYNDMKNTNPLLNEVEQKLLSTLPAAIMLPLSTFFIKPLQRLTKYPLLVKELIKYTEEEAEDYKNLVNAELKIKEICSYANECVRVAEATSVLNWLQSRLPLTLEGRTIVFNSYTNLSIPRQMLIYATVILAKSKKTLRLFLFTDFVLLAKASSNVPKSLLFEGFPNCFTLYKSPIFIKNVEYTISSTSNVEFSLSDVNAGFKFNLEASDGRERELVTSQLEQAIENYKVALKKFRFCEVDKSNSACLRKSVLVLTSIHDFPFDKIEHNMFYFKVTCGKQVMYTDRMEINPDTKVSIDAALESYIEKNFEGRLRINLFNSYEYFPDDYIDHVEIDAQALVKLEPNERIMEKLNFVRNRAATLVIKIFS